MHIFLLILKIIGIVLLCVIGLVLLILAALLFAPFRYEISAEGDKNGPTAHADVKVRWLLRIVNFRLLYDLPGASEYVVKVFGIPIKKSDGKKEEESAEGEPKAEEKAEDRDEAKTEDSGEAKPDGNAAEGKDEKTGDAKPESVSAEPSVTAETEKPKEDSETRPDETESDAKDEAEGELPQELADALEGKKKNKIREKIDKLKAKASSLWDSLEAMFALFMKKKGLLEKYVTKKSTKKAIKMVWTNALWILKHICPKKYHGNVEFGMDDPSMTGEICAAISPWYPMISDYLKITPNFEPGLGVSGDIFLKGRIRLWGILIRAWKVYRNKNVRKVLREAEKVKEKITKTPDEVKEIFEKAA